MFCSLDDLTTALQDWIKTWNSNARPFRWTKTADQIIDLQDLRQRPVLGEQLVDVAVDTVGRRYSNRHGRGSFLR